MAEKIREGIGKEESRKETEEVGNGRLQTEARKLCMTKKKRKKGTRGPGQPEVFTQKLADKICNRLAEGESLRKICRSKGIPTRQTIFAWLRDSEKKDFHIAYANARELWADYTFDESMEIADMASDKIVGDDKSDGARVNAEKLRIETRKWFLSRMNPKKYGEKIDLTTAGKEIKQPKPAVITYIVPKPPEEVVVI